MLQVRGLTVAYPGQPALVRDWSVRIGAGVTQVLGDTGSGKSTLIRVLAGTLSAAGRLTLAGVSLDEDGEAYRREVFFCEPSNDAFDQATARQTTAALGASDAKFDDAAWRALIEGFALVPHLDKPMYMLSTGSRRKVWLAAALASGRTLTLLDEPTAALDAASVACLREALVHLANRPDRVIVVASSERMEHVPLTASVELPLT